MNYLLGSTIKLLKLLLPIRFKYFFHLFKLLKKIYLVFYLTDNIEADIYCASTYLCKISSKSHFPAFTKRSYETGIADKKFNCSLGNSFSVVKDKIQALEVFKVVTHNPGNETLELLHVQRTRDIRPPRAG